MFKDKRYVGILWVLILELPFVLLSFAGQKFLSGTYWFLFSSALRLIFGILALFIMHRIYGKGIKDILHFRNWKQALLAGSGFLIYFLYYLILLCAGCKSVTGLTVGLFFSHILLQQITTGFYEELYARALLLEGYFYQKKQTAKTKLLYASMAFLFFGLAHVITGWDLYTFVFTGIIGFTFAVIYLKSHNIVIPMILHAVYDIFANLTSYIEWNDSALFHGINALFYVVLGLMFMVSVVFLFKKERQI